MSLYTYPGVYILEAPSSQYAITGASTSIAAFIGWSNQGPVGEATMVQGRQQYNTQFGGMIPGNWLGYAVNQFFLNGGTQAYIIRLCDTSAKTASNTIGNLTFYANNPGKWANALFVAVSNVQAASGGHSTFNLQVLMLMPSGLPSLLESYTNLSTDPANPLWAVTVVDSDSTNVTFTPPGGSAPTSLPAPSNSANVWIAAGSLTSGGTLFNATETVKQTGSNSTATVSGTVNGSYLVLTSQPTGTPTGTGVWTGETSNATFAPTTASVQTSGAPLAIDGSATPGADGTTLVPNSAAFETQLTNTATGYPLLGGVPIFNLLCVPGENTAAIVAQLQQFCAQSRAFLIVDAAQTATIGTGSSADLSKTGPADWQGNLLVDQYAANSAFYFPWVSAPDPSAGMRMTLFPPCGFVAGIYAATDASRTPTGVYKAPAGINASIGGVDLQYVLTDVQNGSLNPLGVNCLRQFPNFGVVVWGARTIAGNDALGSQWKYIPIRRLALYIESSLYAGTQWAVFEPNAEPLWGQVRLSIEAFMQGLFLGEAFAGTTPQQAYFVKCDAENNTDATTALGILNIAVGFAPLYPAEFVVIQIQQMMQS